MSGATVASPGLRRAGWAAWALLAAGLGTLGWLRHADRARAWETPALGAPLVPLRGAAAGTDIGTWLVAVNLDCPHCVAAHARLAARLVPGLRVGALLVEHAAPPRAARAGRARRGPRVVGRAR